MTGEKTHTCLFFSTFSIVLQFITCIFVIACAQGCPQYWPEEGMLRYGPVQVECMSCSMDCDVISRLFRVCNLTRVSTTFFFLSFLANSCLFLFGLWLTWQIHSTIFQPQEGYLMVRQFQYLGWAGHREVPASKRSFLKLILQVDQWQREGEEGEGRTIVHCLWVPVRAEPISP